MDHPPTGPLPPHPLTPARDAATGAVMDGRLMGRVLDLFGLADAPPTLPTLEALCARMHQVLGYDTSPKVVWSATDRADDPPGCDPAEFWSRRLDHGASGSCYSACVALHAVLDHLGFDTGVAGWDLAGRRPGIGRHHCTNVVTLDGATWVIESSSPAPGPLRLPGPGQATGWGACTLADVDGTVRMHAVRAASEGVKTYELAETGMSIPRVLECYRDAVRSQPAIQSVLLWSRTRPDGVTESISPAPGPAPGGERWQYLLRRGHMVLGQAPIDLPGIRSVLAARGYSPQWLDQLAAALAPPG